MSSNPPKKGLKFYLFTWAGRLIVINLIVFGVMLAFGANLFLPSTDILLKFGAKDGVSIVQGEYWRFFTPIFLHIGLIHLALNMLALRALGAEIEHGIGAFWFLFIYLAAGIFGNICSALFTVSLSAGASGAIFGLLGAGYVIERRVNQSIEKMTGRRAPRGAYSGMVFLNVLLGVFIPGIDNAAHMGGLFAGLILTFAMLRLSRNRLQKRRPLMGFSVIMMFFVISFVGFLYATSSGYVASHAEVVADASKENSYAVHLYSEVIELEPYNRRAHFKRGRLLLIDSDRVQAWKDLSLAAEDPALGPGMEALEEGLRQSGRGGDAQLVRDALNAVVATRPL